MSPLLAEALAQYKAGHLDRAATLARQVLAAEPAEAEAMHLLGLVCHRIGRFDLALGLIGRAIGLQPGFAEAHLALGDTLRALDRLEDAAESYRTAVAQQPGLYEAQAGLGIVLTGQERLDAAEAAFRTLLKLDPESPGAFNNLGVVFEKQGRSEEAIAHWRQAIDLDAAYAEAHYNLGHILLRQGDFLEGWEEYGWRWWRDDPAQERMRDYPQPFWFGGAAEGRTILLWPEQGLGDAIQFARFAPVLAKAGWQVILEAPPALRRLFAGMNGITVIGPGEPLPAFDVHCPLLGLPRALGTTLDTLPNPVPYLSPRPDLATDWPDRLGGAPGLKIGVAWRGNPQHLRDRQRSVDPAWLAAILDLPGRPLLVSLQKDARPEEIGALEGLGPFMDAGPLLHDMADTAALIAHLDLVVTVDTAVCHLAGALGRPTWTLLDHASDWRWLKDCEDSPWYPTMRLFRQAQPGDWAAVADRVRKELQAL